MAEQFGSNPWPQPPSTAEQYGISTSPAMASSHPADATTQPLRPMRTWPALLILYLLAPIIGEMLSGSTPPLNFIQPFSLIYQPALYGSGAIIVRELVRRRGLGWGSILLLGAAYGILEEGLVVTSWFNPYWPDLGHLSTYGRLFDTSWVWAFGLTTYHAVVSITIPIILTEALFPRLANRPWLSRRGLTIFSVWLGIISLLGLFLFAFVAFRSKGYTHPPLAYLVAVVLAVAFVWLALHLRPSARASVSSARTAPRLWQLRLIAFAATFVFFLNLWLVPNVVSFPLVPVLVVIGLVALAAWYLRRWAGRYDWGPQHRLALAFGALIFFILLSPLLEFFVLPHTDKIPTGMTLVGLAFLVGLILLSWRIKRRLTAVPLDKTW